MSVYSVSDLHGCYEQWSQIRQFLKEDDTLYVLGDCIDRQTSGLGILQEAIGDPRCIVLCGNHEDMMMNALDEEVQYGYSDYWIWRWFQNGGQVTYDEWQEAGRDFGWIGRIKALPLWAEYTNVHGDHILMTHSGCLPKIGYGFDPSLRRLWVWDRDHLKEKRWHRDKNEFVVHGHTTTIHLLENLNILEESDISNPLLVKYCQNHKINIDLCAHYTGICALLNLDSLQPIYFNSEGKINETRSLEVDSGIRKLVSSF